MAEEHEVKKPVHKSSGWSLSKLAWGLFLITIGGLILAQNFGLINLSWGNVWQLWPLIIIAIGLSVLAVQHVVWRIVSVIFTVAALALVVWLAVGGEPLSNPGSVDNVSINKLSNEISSAKISINTGASTLSVNSSDQSEIAKAMLESDIADLKSNSRAVGSVQDIELSMDSRPRFWTGSAKSNFDVSLSQSLPIKLAVSMGASNANLDLSRVRLEVIDIDAGASSIVVKLGDLIDNTKLTIDSGVSSIVVKIPNNSGISLQIDSGLTSRSLADLTKISDGNYESLDYDIAQKVVDIDANIGLSSFTIERY
jgi:hypothetical protein